MVVVHSVASVRHFKDDPLRARKVGRNRLRGLAALRRDLGYDLSVGDDAEDYAALSAALVVYSDKRGER